MMTRSLLVAQELFHYTLNRRNWIRTRTRLTSCGPRERVKFFNLNSGPLPHTAQSNSAPSEDYPHFRTPRSIVVRLGDVRYFHGNATLYMVVLELVRETRFFFRIFFRIKFLCSGDFFNFFKLEYLIQSYKFLLCGVMKYQ